MKNITIEHKIIKKKGKAFIGYIFIPRVIERAGLDFMVFYEQI